jgi:hypothetical protein
MQSSVSSRYDSDDEISFRYTSSSSVEFAVGTRSYVGEPRDCHQCTPFLATESTGKTTIAPQAIPTRNIEIGLVSMLSNQPRRTEPD